MFLKTPELETERLILKKGEVGDFINVYEYDFTKLRDICGEFEFVKCDPKIAASFATYSEETENVYDWIIYLKETMVPIGNLVAEQHAKEVNDFELSFNLHPTHWGNGYMKEAVIETMKFLFEKGCDNVVSAYDEGNIKSRRIHEKIGFEFYKDEENSWEKNGVSINKHILIMSNAKFNELYSSNIK